jgi:DNA-binding HxlR family transcriptional regulator
VAEVRVTPHRSAAETEGLEVADPAARALAGALDQVGDRWTLQVVHALLAGSRRFGELQHDLGVAPNVLSQRLRALEAAGLVVAEPYQRRPPRHAYRLTQRGRELAGVLRALASWAAEAGPRHEACGTALETRWWCPTCDRPADVEEDGLIRL